MSQKFNNIKVGINEELEEHLERLSPNYSSYHIIKKSIDARKRHQLHFVYSVEVFAQGETPPERTHNLETIDYNKQEPVIIVGAGPAGLFAALRLSARGISCIILEQGSPANERMKFITQHWRYGKLNPRDNVCFGEGGAGLFSDGKLITRVKSPYIPYVMDELVEGGAPQEILYLSNPHVGSDKIRRVIPRLRTKILKQGGQIHFNKRVDSFLFGNGNILGLTTDDGASYHSPHIILACGHSAEDIFYKLHANGVTMEGKSFAVGLRVEHPQKFINQMQYRDFAGHPKLDAANYRLTYNDPEEKIGVYSFCMCPGGYVLSTSTEPDGVVCNGMSNYKRNSPYANAAIVVTVDHKRNFGQKIFGGLEFRRQLEHSAFEQLKASGHNKELPAQKLTDFFAGRSGPVDKGSSPSGAAPARLDQLFDDRFKKHLFSAFDSFDKSMEGFASDFCQLYGVESRTSCPIRIVRDPETLESVSHEGLYPTGEGAGYAGGITSAACDGVKVAEAIVAKVNSQAHHRL